MGIKVTPFSTETRCSEEGVIEIKASGEENGVTAKGRLCHPELTDLLGTSCRCVWSRGRGRAAGRTGSRSG